MRTSTSTLSAPDDAKGRLISIFVGAVLLPSIALSYVSVRFTRELTETRIQSDHKRAERTLYYIERDLVQSAHAKALEGARAVGTEVLLDGRQEAVREALEVARLDPTMFQSLHLEAPSIRIAGKSAGGRNKRPEEVRELMAALGSPLQEGEDQVPWLGSDGHPVGLLRFRFSAGYVHRRLVKEYFEREFAGLSQLVLRVSEPDGELLYETAPTPSAKFEVERRMESASFRDLRLALRYKDVSIAGDARRWQLWTLSLIGLIDLTLGAGLYLVYSNVRREMRLSRLKSDFVANVSHELKTPLALVRLFAETLELGRVPSQEKAARYYRIINKESQRLTQLIDNILDFSRIEAGRKEYRLGRTDVARVVAEVVEAYRFPIEQQGFGLEVEVAADLPAVSADQEALTQALLNLMNNAVKFSRGEKAITLRVTTEDGFVRISVSDKGIGVAKSEQRKIFEKFYRAEDSLVHETKGSGLGLPLVRHIMDAHGGRVEVESQPGQGSTFSLVLPVAGGDD